MEETVLPLGSNKVSILAIAQAVIFVAITVLLALWASAALEERLMRVDTMHLSLRAVLARMGKAILILVAVLLSLSAVGIDLTVLSVFGGALGVGIGLGLQKIVSNYVSGFVILIERSLSIGDMVAVDKYAGRVTQINTRYTVLRSADGSEAVIPNEMLLSNAVQNLSLTDKSLRLATRVTVGYESDVDLTLMLLIEAASGVARVSKAQPPHAFLLNFGADGLEMELGFWIDDPENGRSNVLSEVNREVWRAFQRHAINIPYPQREIRLIDKVETQKRAAQA
jgi:small-conductance mechanosensitive channel